jgi:hypothetical protein
VSFGDKERKAEVMKRIIALSTIIVLAAAFGVHGQNIVSKQPYTNQTTADRSSWDKNFPVFLVRLAKLLGQKPSWPPIGIFGVMAAKDDKGENIWLIPQSIPECPEVTAIQNTFAGKTIAWQLRFERADENTVYFVKPTLGDQNKPLNQWFSLTATVADRKTVANLKSNQEVIVRGELGLNLFEGVYLGFGIGPNKDKISLGVSLQKATVQPK